MRQHQSRRTQNEGNGTKTQYYRQQQHIRGNNKRVREYIFHGSIIHIEYKIYYQLTNFKPFPLFKKQVNMQKLKETFYIDICKIKKAFDQSNNSSKQHEQYHQNPEN